MAFSTYAKLFSDEAAAIAFIEKKMWPNGPVCPHCGATDRINHLDGVKDKKGNARLGLWKCYHCRGQFTVRKGTIFEDSHIQLSKWMFAIHQMCASKKGVSATQLMRELDLSYKAAWFMCHRIRLAMARDPLASMLGGPNRIVEIDETYVGGKPKNNKHKNRTKAAGRKVAVMTLLDREGAVKTVVVPDTKKTTLQTIAQPIVDKSATIVTDAHLSYEGLDKHFAAHHTVDHSKQYVRAVILHTNFAESYHSLLKRGLIGTFHHVSERHLPKYLSEFDYRWNTRHDSDAERTEAAIAGAAGKRMMYRAPSRS
jgi:transposase-like protein